jgi:Domain of unknown function (DUF4396)
VDQHPREADEARPRDTATLPDAAPMEAAGLDRLARQATTHCLTRWAIGEVVGMAVTGVASPGAATSVAVSIALAFVFGYWLTMWPLVRSGASLRTALGLAFASDSVSLAG